MKIKKLVESKLIEADIDPDDSVKEIADDIKDTIDEISGGEKEISDDKAIEVAKETRKVADAVNAGEVAIVIDGKDWSDIIVSNKLYKALDKSLKAALENSGVHRVKAGANILVEGLPGSGKTSIVEAWCNMRGLTLVALNATDSKLDAAINGMPLRDVNAQGENAITYSYNVDDNGLGKLLYEKHPKLKDKCVLFVDEFNRQNTPQLRRPLMSLFNEKRNAAGTLDFSKNLLFSVVAINPFGNDFHDKGVGELNAAENDRFLRHLKLDSDIEDARQYWTWFRNSELLKMGIIAPGSAASTNHGGWVGPTKELSEDDKKYAKRVLKMSTLALYILNNVQKSRESEVFTTRKDTDKAYRAGSKRYTTSRSLFDGIADSTYGDDKSPVADFLDWVDDESDYTSEKVQMFHDILDSYIMDVKGLFAAYNIDKTPKEIKAELDGTATPKADITVGDNVDDEIEDDDVMFGADDISGVSKASTDDLSKDDVDSIMGSWL